MVACGTGKSLTCTPGLPSFPIGGKELGNAEALLHGIDPAKAYPLDFVIFRITGYHPKDAEALLFPGEALQHDQRVMRAAAQCLSASEQEHQGRILRRAGLDRSPRQVVEPFIVAPVGGRERQLTTVVPLRAAEVSS